MAPRAAVRYFRRLIPRLRLRSGPFARRHIQGAFTAAAAVEQRLVDRLKEPIAAVLEQGVSPRAATRTVQRLLDEAGVSPRNPDYSSMLVRTNAMNAYNEGATAEMQDPNVAESFPVWKWLGIRDGRQRHSHEVHFDRYYPNHATFAAVRDSVRGEYDGYNDRCTMQPVYKGQWKRLQAAGARVEPWPG